MMHDWFQHTQSLVTNSNNNSSNDICRVAIVIISCPREYLPGPIPPPLSRQRVRKSACSCFFLRGWSTSDGIPRGISANYSNWFINIAVTIYYKYFRRFLWPRYGCTYQFKKHLIWPGCELLVTWPLFRSETYLHGEKCLKASLSMFLVNRYTSNRK